VTLLPLKACWSYWDLQLYFSANGVPGWAPESGVGCPDAAQVAAIRYAADEGAKVINISLGGTRASPAIADALRYAVNRGAFVSISAGNDADDGNPTMYPAAYAADIDGVHSRHWQKRSPAPASAATRRSGPPSSRRATASKPSPARPGPRDSAAA
jgi:hypothetical protein